MKRVWYRQDREAVRGALRRGQRPELATTMACGPLDELVALHDQLGILPAVAGLHVPRQRAGLPDRLVPPPPPAPPLLPPAAPRRRRRRCPVPRAGPAAAAGLGPGPAP